MNVESAVALKAVRLIKEKRICTVSFLATEHLQMWTGGFLRIKTIRSRTMFYDSDGSDSDSILKRVSATEERLKQRLSYHQSIAVEKYFKHSHSVPVIERIFFRLIRWHD